MSSYRLEFTLRQHTPLIHFQHEQPGATLRATELKPKLDRFLLMKDPGLPCRSHHGDRHSLEYKVRIEGVKVTFSDIEKPNPKEPNNPKKAIKNPLFFANMGDGEKKKFSMAEKVKIDFTTFDPKIREAIETHFEAFLAAENFGTRQSKGFGCFYPEARRFDPELVDRRTYTKVYRFSAKTQSYEALIRLLYMFLRTGINEVNFRTKETLFYTKPASFLYAKKLGYTWDKKAVKTELFHAEKKSDGARYALIRDLFGLSTEQLWLSYSDSLLKEHPKIARFKSPVIFKPMVNGDRVDVYFFARKDISDILGETFTVKTKKGRREMKLATPEAFDMEAFMDFAVKLDLSKIVEAKYHKTNSFNQLDKILKEAGGRK